MTSYCPTIGQSKCKLPIIGHSYDMTSIVYKHYKLLHIHLYLLHFVDKQNCLKIFFTHLALIFLGAFTSPPMSPPDGRGRLAQNGSVENKF